MFTLSSVRTLAVLSFGLFACSSETPEPTALGSEQLVQTWIASADHVVTSLKHDAVGAEEFEILLPEGRMVVAIARFDGTPLTAPLTFHPATMTEFAGRDSEIGPTLIAPDRAGQWITSDTTSTLCGNRKVDSYGTVTLADGTEHQVGVGLGWEGLTAARTTAGDKPGGIATAGCPVPGGAKACDGAECSIKIFILGHEVGEVAGSCQEGTLFGVRTCLCNVINPDDADETSKVDALESLDRVETPDLK